MSAHRSRERDTIGAVRTPADDAADDPATTCPIGPVMDVVFSRWTTPILLTLHRSGRLRFGDLQRRIDTITPKVLTQGLRRLERDGLVRRHHHAGVPPRVEYEITELGRSLGPVFAALAGWSAEHLPEVERSRLAFDTVHRPLALRHAAGA